MSAVSFKLTQIINGDPLKGIDHGTRKAMLETAIKVTAQAKALAPIDTGLLRNSIMYKLDDKDGGLNDGPGQRAENKITPTPGKYDAYVGSNTNYAATQEFGSRTERPQPYIRPAVDIVVKGASYNDFIKRINENEMKKALLKGSRKKEIR